MFHPWRRLRGRPQIDLSWVSMPLRLGETDGRTLIRMHPDQDQAQRRCTLAHELAHVELGHTSGCDGRGERDARHLAARWLIHFPALLDALRWSEELEEVAHELWVDIDTLHHRLDALTSPERAAIVTAYRETEGGC